MKLDTHIGNVDIKIDTKRTDRNLREAQKVLNVAVRDDCEPLVPHLKGGLRDSVRFPDAEGIYGGEIEWNVPYAHFQYTGYVRTDEAGRVFVNKYEEKPILTDRPLQYSEQGTTSKWFEEAKRLHKNEWLKAVRDEVGKN